MFLNETKQNKSTLQIARRRLATRFVVFALWLTQPTTEPACFALPLSLSWPTQQQQLQLQQQPANPRTNKQTDATVMTATVTRFCSTDANRNSTTSSRFNLRQSNFVLGATGNAPPDSSELQPSQLEAARGPLGAALDSKDLKSKYSVSSFLLHSAQQPLWLLAYNSLSSFGKIA